MVSGKIVKVKCESCGETGWMQAIKNLGKKQCPKCKEVGKLYRLAEPSSMGPMKKEESRVKSALWGFVFILAIPGTYMILNDFGYISTGAGKKPEKERTLESAREEWRFIDAIEGERWIIFDDSTFLLSEPRMPYDKEDMLSMTVDAFSAGYTVGIVETKFPQWKLVDLLNRNGFPKSRGWIVGGSVKKCRRLYPK